MRAVAMLYPHYERVNLVDEMDVLNALGSLVQKSFPGEKAIIYYKTYTRISWSQHWGANDVTHDGEGYIPFKCEEMLQVRSNMMKKLIDNLKYRQRRKNKRMVKFYTKSKECDGLSRREAILFKHDCGNRALTIRINPLNKKASPRKYYTCCWADCGNRSFWESRSHTGYGSNRKQMDRT